MSLRVGLSLLFLSLALACRRGSENATVDTTMVFVAHPTPPSGQATAVPSEDSIDATFRAYIEKRISADAAAKVIVDYVNSGHSLNANFDPELRRAIDREIRKRGGP